MWNIQTKKTTHLLYLWKPIKKENLMSELNVTTLISTFPKEPLIDLDKIFWVEKVKVIESYFWLEIGDSVTSTDKSEKVK